MITLNRLFPSTALADRQAFPKKDRVDLIVVMNPVLVHKDLWITMRKNGISTIFLFGMRT